jgi:GT2 family glycosyltransferase
MNRDDLLSTAVFSPDLIEAQSGWLGHLPFASWLIREFEPKVFVELGTHYGHSYFAFCKTVLEADLATKCYAVDTWLGDEHAGRYGDEIFDQVNSRNRGSYSEFSRLMRMNFDDAVGSFEDGSIDLLHIDGLHTYEAVRHDFETWLPKLAPGAVVLFHDTNVYERNFGVWKLWEELKAEYPNHLEFVHSHGLGVLQLTNCINERQLPWLRPNSPEKHILIEYITALGMRQMELSELRRLRTQVGALTQDISERDGQIADLTHALAESTNTVTLICQSASWRITRPLRVLRGLALSLRIVFDSQIAQRVRTASHWILLQARLIREDGIFARAKALARRLFKGSVAPFIFYVRARPLLRARLFYLAKQIGVDGRVVGIYNRVQSLVATAGDPFLLRQQATASYSNWLAHFDTPTNEDLLQLEVSAHPNSFIFVIARFDETSEEYAEHLAVRLLKSIGQQWQAAFVFAPNCKSTETIDRIRRATGSDARISFGTPVLITAPEFIVLVEGGALPRSHALRIFADALRGERNALVAYSDEDQYNGAGPSGNPWFKPKFSPLLAEQGMLLGGMVALRPDTNGEKQLLSKLTNAHTDAAAVVREYALSGGESRVVHIPHVLYHDAFSPRAPLPLSLELPTALPAVSVIIPTRDRWDLLGACLESLKYTDWPRDRFEIIVVDNGSTDAFTLRMLAEAENTKLIRVIRDDLPFNWSRLNNLAVGESRGDLLVFLNNDTEIIDKGWLKKIARHLLRPGTGAVGCKLLYPDRTVQHGGVVAGIMGVAGHAHLGLAADEGGYRNLANITHEVSALTGACLAVTRENFYAVGGFNESFRVAFNDVVFCFDLHVLGKRNVYVGEALVVHHESKSRGYDDTPEKLAINRVEAQNAWSLHPQLMRNDPYYSPNLSLGRPYELGFAPRRPVPWDDRSRRAPRVMMLSVTHAIGHGVAVVVDKQAEALVRHGYQVIVAGPMSANDFPYPGCERVEVHDAQSAATLAAQKRVDLIIAHTPPFFSVARWTGTYPPVLAYDYGEPPSDWFPDAEARRAVLAEKDQSLIMASAVFTISEAVAAESRTPVHGVLPLGNSHLGQWDDACAVRRESVRKKRGWENKFVVLNVCRFHEGERVYKGVNTYADLRDVLHRGDKQRAEKTIFVLCGKGSPEDVKVMTARGLTVAANVTDEEMADLYCAADAYANFSKWEGYNLGIGQALAMGLPTIASDIPAHRAFGVEVTKDVEDAAVWLIRAAGQGGNRTPRIWSWEGPLERFIQEVTSVCGQTWAGGSPVARICSPSAGVMLADQHPSSTEMIY